MVQLEDQSRAHNNSAVAAGGCAFVQKVRSRIDGRSRNSVIALVQRIEYIGAKLESNGFADARVFDNAEVNIFDAVRAQNVSTSIADALSGRERREQIRTGVSRRPRAALRLNFPY